MNSSVLQPTLKSELLLLKPLKPEDFQELYEAASDPLIWEQHPASDRFKKDVFEQFFAQALACKGALSVIDVRTKKIIGCSRFYDADLDKKEVVIGFTFLKRDYWGGTYNKDLKRLMMDHGFNYFETIQFHVGEFNTRSQMAMTKIGGKKIGQKQMPASGGGQRTIIIYEITKNDYFSRM